MTAYVISSGVTSSGLTLQAGDTAQVLNGGAVVDTTVLSGGTLQLSSGGVARGATVISGGGVVDGAGSIGGVVDDFGVASGVTLLSGAVLTVEAAGMAVGVTEVANAAVTVVSGGVADAVVLNGNAATLVVASGSTATSTVVVAGQEIVSGVDLGATISGGSVMVTLGGATFGDTVLSGGREVVSSGGTASDLAVASGGLLVLKAHGGVAAAKLAPGAIIDLAGVLATGANADVPGQLSVTSGGAVVAVIALSEGVGGLTFSTHTDGAGGTDVVVSRSVAQDFNGDGSSDVLLRGSSGYGGIWFTSAGGLQGLSLGLIDPSWTIQAVGDFNGDGKADILWRNTDGDLGEWVSKAGTGYTGFTTPILANVDPSWVVQGVGSFNGGSLTDILWRRSNGDTSFWLTHADGGHTAIDIGVVDLAWTIQGIGDFNGDGKADILWRNSNGAVGEWLSKSGAGFGDFTTPILSVVPASWQVQGIGDFAGNGLSDILWRNTNGDTGIWLTTAGGGYTAIDFGTVDSSWSIQAVADYNGDGKADILWRNANGQFGEWLSKAGSGFTGFTTPTLGQSPPALTLFSNNAPAIPPNVASIPVTQDFNADGKSDVLAMDSSGDVGIWLTSGGGLQNQDLGVVTGGWTIQAVGDFNADGKADILWRNTDGDVGEWVSKPGAGYTGFTTPILANVDSSWVVQGTGNFNGGAQSDILWRRTNGETGFWLTRLGGGFTPIDIGIVDTNWTIQGIGDFNGDGKADILWRNAVTGAVGEWLSNAGPGYAGFTTPVLANVEASWHIRGVGDFTGGGLSDILWRNANGDTGIWITNDNGGFTAVDIGTVDTSWSIQAVADYNGDGKADILWRNTNGQYGEWLSKSGSGFNGFTTTVLGTAPPSLTIIGNNPPAIQGGIGAGASQIAQAMASMGADTGGGSLVPAISVAQPATQPVVAAAARQWA